MLDNAGGLVYGTILVATLLAAESARRETYVKTEVAVVITLVLYWLTIAYAEYAGERLTREEHFRFAGFAREAVRQLTVLYGSTIPLVVILVFWAAGATLSTAVAAATWFAAAVIVGTEVAIGVRAGLRGGELVRQTAVGAVLGLLIIALRVVLH